MGSARANVVARLVAILLSVMMLAGCAQIPHSGEPELVDSDGIDQSTGFAFFPEGPADGASIEEVVRGFIDAGVGAQDNFAVARQFLTPELAATWDPTVSVNVYDGSPTVTVDDDDAATVDLTVVATVDEHGQYAEASSAGTVSQSFTMAEVDGQWRISSAPDGVMIISPRFNLVYSQQVLYFYDPSYGYRVPDVRWIPSGPASATRLVTLLLEGPSEWLSGGVVVTAFPAGTRLSASSIVIDDSGEVVIDMTSEALSASPRIKQLMLLQLRSALSGLNNVSRVTMAVDGARLQVDEVTDDVPILNPSPYPQQLVVAQDGVVGLLGEGTDLEEFGTLSSMIAAADPILFAVRQPLAAVVNSTGMVLIDSDNATQLQLTTVSDVGDPSIDPWDYTWATIDGDIAIFDTAGDASAVAVPWLTDRVVAMRVSRDGTRVAMLLSDVSGRTAVQVAGIVRSDDGVPTQIAIPTSIGTLSGRAVGLTWYDDKSLAVVTASGETATTTLMVVGGVSSTMTVTDSVEMVTAGNGRDSIRLLLESGTVVSPRGSGWLPLLENVTSIGYLW